MYVIEFLGVFQYCDTSGKYKLESQKKQGETHNGDNNLKEIAVDGVKLNLLQIIEEIYFEKSSVKEGNTNADLGKYLLSVKQEWDKNKKNIRSLETNRELIVTDSCDNDLQYFICRDKKVNSNNKNEVSLNIIMISTNSVIEEDVKAVCNKIKEVLEERFNFTISHSRKLKLFIYNHLSDDIVGENFFIDIKIQEKNVLKSIKKQLNKTVGFTIFTIFLSAIFQNQLTKLYSLYTSTGSNSIVLSTKISLLANIMTGLWVTCVFEGLILAFDAYRANVNDDIVIKIDPETAVTKLQQYAESSLYKTGKGLEDDVPVVPE